uniref:MAM domain-containing protein n=1 Tax=Ascaris lumbricoides TaxID=6252 RepID=A0A0M3IKX2_ASCLU
GCSPFNGDLFNSFAKTLSSRRALGENTQRSIPISFGGHTINSLPIEDPNDLSCNDFDGHCRWHNIEGLLVDEMDWFQGTGKLDVERLHISTGTDVMPEGDYGIAATDVAQLPNAKAVLVSDVISCQVGPAELRFRYWTSPGVRITVCAKQMIKFYPSFDFCSDSVEIGDPGPAFVSIPDLDKQPFQIFITADNFVFRATNLEGGFAIIDDIEYYGDLCTNPNNMMPPKHNFFGDEFSDAVVHQSSTSEPPTLIPPSNIIARLAEIDTLTPQNEQDSRYHNKFIAKVQQPRHYASLCSALQCSFESEPCVDYIAQSDWILSSEPVGTIKGDASLLPFNPEGSFAYVNGPRRVSRLQTPPFDAQSNFYLLFAYYKTSNISKFNVIIKQTEHPFEHIIFTAPQTVNTTERWFREGRTLQAGSYDYVSECVAEL